ncbi:MAG: hypothetical protein U9N87_00080 [Planctomycetota bacterium]|nr:hypothetical protein [Planctomycetota bacterium]
MRDDTVFPVEIKKTTVPTKKDIRHFSVLERIGLKVGRGCVLCMSDKNMPITETVQAVSLSRI